MPKITKNAGNSQASQKDKTVSALHAGLAKYRALPKSRKTDRKTTSTRAGLLFATPKILKLMKRERLAGGIGKRPAIVVAAAMEYICQEILELSGDIVLQGKRKRITPRQIMLAISGDDELHKLVGYKGTFHESGVAPHIHPAMLPKNAKKAIIES